MGDVFPWTLRHSLERVIVGEARNQEIVSLLRAMSRGYRGSMASFHADTARETFESMATLLIDHAPSLTHEAAMRQIATALDFIVFIDREQVTDRVTGEPTEVHVQRWPAAMPQYTVGHADRLATIDSALTSVPGIHLTGAAYRGVGLAGCISQAARTATAVLDRHDSTTDSTTHDDPFVTAR